MHIGKTAGTALRFTLVEIRRRPHTEWSTGHTTRLDECPPGQKFFFCVRDPTDRFLSGFLSRQREGRPRFDMPWNEEEAIAFSRFSSAEEMPFR